jgi:lysophospholipase L1-like esterase
MFRSFSWNVAVAALIAFAVSVSELQGASAPREVTNHKYRDHADVRQFMITAALADAPAPIVVIGDSITEMAPLPRQICGHPVVNAGVGGQTIREATRLASRVLGKHAAYLIAIAIGANDVGSPRTQSDFEESIKTVKPLSERPIIAAAVSGDQQTSSAIAAAAAANGVTFVAPLIPAALKMADGIHYTAAAYEIWLPALEAALSKECG